MTTRLIIDCDPGNGIPGANVDDGLALALALAAGPALALEMVTIVAGNTPRDVGVSVAAALLRAAGRQDIPVIPGAACALLEPPGPWRAYLDRVASDPAMSALWAGTARPAPVAIEAPTAAIAMAQLIVANPGQITLAAIGPLTNVAHALQLYPQMAQRVKEIVIMGGTFNVEGYIKDTNFAVDPEAARLVLASGANITLAPLDVTTRTLMTPADLARLTAGDNALCRYLRQTTAPWIEYSMQARKLPGCWIHDALTVAWLLEPDLVTVSDYHVDVAVDGALTRGSSRRWKPGSLRLTLGLPQPQGQPVRVMETVDNVRLLSLIERALAA
jgi:pyrimidine-specific ribonucleoside hydrolase